MKTHNIRYVSGASQHLCLFLLLAPMNTDVLAAAGLHINTADVCRCVLCCVRLSVCPTERKLLIQTCKHTNGPLCFHARAADAGQPAFCPSCRHPFALLC